MRQPDHGRANRIRAHHATSAITAPLSNGACRPFSDQPSAMIRRPDMLPGVEAELAGEHTAADLILAQSLADIADSITIQYFGSNDLGVSQKADGSPVTAADRIVEAELREMLRRLRPQDVVLGEELGGDGFGGRRWLIDPIDGTAGYLRGKPYWRTLIALEQAGSIQLGIASSPGIHQRWWATRGGGAWTQTHTSSPETADDGRSRLAVSTTYRLDQAVLAIWPPPERWPVPFRSAASRVQAASLPAPDPDPAGTRHGALLVAAGHTDAFLMAGAGPWDLAALALIVDEAGGRFTDMTGAQSLHTGVGIFSNGVVHEQILGQLQ